MLDQAPTIKTPKGAATAKMKGRPITAEEAERMLVKTADVVGPEAAPTWQRFLRGLWLSGLRIGEAVKLSWEPEAAVSVCLEGAPCFRFRAGGQNSGRVELCPMAPDFAAQLQAAFDAQNSTDRVPTRKTAHA